MEKRKQITFDIDTKIAEKIFGSGYRKIYMFIELCLEKAGFIHIEGSVYQSDTPLENTKVAFTIRNMVSHCPGLEKCIRDIRLADITDENSLNYLFQYDGTTGKYPDKSKSKTKQRDDYTR